MATIPPPVLPPATTRMRARLTRRIVVMMNDHGAGCLQKVVLFEMLHHFVLLAPIRNVAQHLLVSNLARASVRVLMVNSSMNTAPSSAAHHLEIGIVGRGKVGKRLHGAAMRRRMCVMHVNVHDRVAQRHVRRMAARAMRSVGIGMAAVMPMMPMMMMMMMVRFEMLGSLLVRRVSDIVERVAPVVVGGVDGMHADNVMVMMLVHAMQLVLDRVLFARIDALFIGHHLLQQHAKVLHRRIFISALVLLAQSQPCQQGGEQHEAHL